MTHTDLLANVGTRIYIYTRTGFAFAGTVDYVTSDGAVVLRNAEMVFATGALDRKHWKKSERCPGARVVLSPGEISWWFDASGKES